MSERLFHNITAPKLMDLGFSIVSDILFITKHKSDHKFDPNLNIDKILSVIDSPGHFQEAKKERKALSHKVLPNSNDLNGAKLHKIFFILKVLPFS